MTNLTETADVLLKAASDLEKLAGRADLERPITGDKALRIYNNYIGSGKKAIDFFKKVEAMNKPSKKLDAAFLAAGGPPSGVVPDRVSKPSSPLYDKWEFIVMNPQRMNMREGGDPIAAIMSLGRNQRIWEGFFSKELLDLKDKSAAATDAYRTG